MNKPQVLSTTPIAGAIAGTTVAATALLTAYYRLTVPLFLSLLCLFYLLWSYGWTLMSCRSTKAEGMALPERIFAGETFTWNFKFKNEGIFPLVRCGIQFLVPDRFAFSSNHPVTAAGVANNEEINNSLVEIPAAWKNCTAVYSWVPETKEISVNTVLTPQSRGYYYFPPAHFFVGDPSGLYRGMNQVSQDHYLYVFPRLKSNGEIMKILALAENHREDSFGVEDYYQILGVRDYQLSDPPKSINWYATARSGSLKSNLYQRQDSEYCLVVLDVSAAGSPGYDTVGRGGKDSLLEEAISLAAGIALFHLEQGARTAFYTNAHLTRWEKRDKSKPGSTGAYMKRVRGITALDFAAGETQAQDILKLCATIDGTSRAGADEQGRLWAQVQQAPANALVYLLGYHNPPAGWLAGDAVDNANYDPAKLYSPGRLAGLAASKVRLLNLSQGGDSP